MINFNFIIKTKNTFPHSSGISSSASGISALTLCLIKLEEKLGYKIIKKDKLLQRASFLTRLGSGSSCRSIYPGLVIWGKHKYIKNSSNLYAIPYPNKVHKIFTNFFDTILVIDKTPKNISSSEGHNLMNHHPYAKQRFKLAYKNLDKLITILEKGDIEGFGEIIEYEALNLHTMIMSSRPYFFLIKPNTLHVIEKILDFRNLTKKSLYFTLDAGANIHLLYPFKEELIVKKFIREELLKYCIGGEYIEDICCF